MYQIQIKREANGKNFYCEATLSNNTLPLQYAETSLTKYYRVKCKHSYFLNFYLLNNTFNENLYIKSTIIKSNGMYLFI